MPTNKERVREVTANELDDYFKDDTIGYYLDKALQNVVSYLIQKERNGRESLRGLDNLRTAQTKQTGSYSNTGSYSKAAIDFDDVIGDYTLLQTEDIEVLRELKTNELPLLKWGNLSPNYFEGYYHVTGGNFELYLPDPDQREIIIHYIDKPSDSGGEGFADLPERLENAVIYNAAALMIMQESAKEVNSPAKKFLEIYQRELQLNSY